MEFQEHPVAGSSEHGKAQCQEGESFLITHTNESFTDAVQMTKVL